jgi:hypothetical protein
MKLSEVTQSGFYWARDDEYRQWAMVFLTRQAINPVHPRYNKWEIHNGDTGQAAPFQKCQSPNHEDAEFIGPVSPPPAGDKAIK